MINAVPRLVADTVRRLDIGFAGVPSSYPASDPYEAGFVNSANQESKVVAGVIVDCIAGGHKYRVSYGPGSYGWATPNSSAAGFGTVGMRPVTTYVIGQRVRVRLDPNIPDYGSIESAEPYAAFHRAYQPSDTWWPIFRSGHSADTAHTDVIDELVKVAKTLPGQPDGVDLQDLAANRPLDSTSVGEYGAHAETGTWIGADPFHAFLRTDEATGVFAFYRDQHLRLSAAKFWQKWTPLQEDEDYNNNGELQGTKIGWMYPWESVGLWAWNQVTPGRAASGQIGQGIALFNSNQVQSGLGIALREPENVSQVPAGRWYEFSGYLGQGSKRTVALPLQWPVYFPQAANFKNRNLVIGQNGQVTFLDGGEEDTPPVGSYVQPNDRIWPDGPSVSREEDDYAQKIDYDLVTSQPGVQDESRTISGKFLLRTAKGVAIVKRPAIPTPRRRLRPNDPAVKLANYSPNGLLYSNSQKYTDDLIDHFVLPELPIGVNVDSVSAVHDMLAYSFNWETLHPFAYANTTWHVPEEKDIAAMILRDSNSVARLGNQTVPDYATLAYRQMLAKPSPMWLEIDHRLGRGRYYANESGVILHDDGNVSIYGGAGEEIRFYNGTIDITAPGDINIRAGGNVNVMSGADTNINARRSFDATSNVDTRLKAGNNMQLLAGASGCGGVLIESQAVCPGYLFENAQGEDVKSSGILLLARDSQVYAVATDIVMTTNADDSRIILDAGTGGTIRTKAKFEYSTIEEDGARVQFFVDGGTSTAANEFTSTRNFFGKQVIVGGKIYSPSAVVVGGAASSAGARSTYLNSTLFPAQDAAVNNPPGADAVEFTFRNDEQYGTDTGFQVLEARWQLLARMASQTLDKWTETPIYGAVSSLPMYSFPGTPWASSTTFKMQNPVLVDPTQKFTAVDRLDGDFPSEDYTDVIIPEPVTSTMAANYTVTKD